MIMKYRIFIFIVDKSLKLSAFMIAAYPVMKTVSLLFDKGKCRSRDFL